MSDSSLNLILLPSPVSFRSIHSSNNIQISLIYNVEFQDIGELLDWDTINEAGINVYMPCRMGTFRQKRAISNPKSELPISNLSHLEYIWI